MPLDCLRGGPNEPVPIKRLPANGGSQRRPESPGIHHRECDVGSGAGTRLMGVHAVGLLNDGPDIT